MSDFIPLAIPNLSGNEARYLQQCVETNFVSSVGPFVERFEHMVAETCGTADAVAVTSGTAALHLALLAHGVGAGDIVLMPSLTFIAPANAVSHTGATPTFMDVSPESWTLDPEAVEEFLRTNCQRTGVDVRHTESGARVTAILTVHTLGHPSDMPRLAEIAEGWNLKLIGDAAAAMGATCSGTPVTAVTGLSALSFNGNKTVTCGGGGVVTGTDEALLKKIRHLSTTARVGSDYDHDQIGYNYRMTNLQAAVGCAQMERFDELLTAKGTIAKAYDRAFEDISALSPFPCASWATSANWFCGVIADDANRATSLISVLTEAGIGARQFWKPMHLQTPYKDSPTNPMPVTDAIWQRVVTLPCSTGLTEAEQGRVIDAVHTAMGNT